MFKVFVMLQFTAQISFDSVAEAGLFIDSFIAGVYVLRQSCFVTLLKALYISN